MVGKERKIFKQKTLQILDKYLDKSQWIQVNQKTLNLKLSKFKEKKIKLKLSKLRENFMINNYLKKLPKYRSLDQ